MKIDWLKPLLDAPGPFVSVYIDTTRPGEDTREVESRWNQVRRSLERDGAPVDILDCIGNEVQWPTRIAGLHGRVILANTEGILVDRVTKDPPTNQEGYFGPIPALIQAAAAAAESVDYLRVVIDRLGADLTWSEAGGHMPYLASESVEGGHTEVTKGGPKRASQRSIVRRAEDSWERNAEVVAAEIDRLVTEVRPELILLTGDVRAVALLRNELNTKTLDLVVDVAGGARGPGVNEQAFEANVCEALEGFRRDRRAQTLAEFQEGYGRGDLGVMGLFDVVTMLARGQVAELLLSREHGPGTVLETGRVWVGAAPLEIAVARSRSADNGVPEDLQELSASVGLVRAALGQDAGLTFVDPDELPLIDGVGAILRWPDGVATSVDSDVVSSRR